jgi:hypothetical protein
VTVTVAPAPDTIAPTSTITSPTAQSSLTVGVPFTITGTAADTGGGTVTRVEVSLDGGTTWQVATGTSSWTYSWTPAAVGPVTLRSRALDSSGNLELPGPGVTVTVDSLDAPHYIWDNTPIPPGSEKRNGKPIEVGLKFRSDVDGYITGIRYYAGQTKDSVGHIGHLWTKSGQLLATVTFAPAVAAGWQEATLSAPVAISANTTYVVSQYSPDGVYMQSRNYLETAPSNSPVRALSDGEDGPNGVSVSGSSRFPTNSSHASNYWVDVVFKRSLTP